MSINLLPWRDIQYQKHKKAFCIESAVALVFVVLMLVVLHGHALHVSHRLSEQIARLQHDLEEIDAAYQRGIQAQKRLRMEQAIFQNFNQQVAVNDGLLSTLGTIVNKLPDAMYLTHIDTQAGYLYLRGVSPSQSQIAHFFAAVAGSLKKQAVLAKMMPTTGDTSAIPFEMGYDTSLQKTHAYAHT